MIPLSILELGRVREGFTRRDALDHARDVARLAEASGYRRIWVAEHHNMRGVTTAATSIVIAHLAAATERIRVGAGGVMLPNHAPYVIAEQFGTLETLFPGRIDLGLGRAPGTDGLTLRALRRDPSASEHFPEDVRELAFFLGEVQPGQRIEAVPGSGTDVPLWILGSSQFGAGLAAELGLPYGFASHFAPQLLDSALAIYRDRYRPTERNPSPYALVGVNVIAAETDEEAHRLWTSQQLSFAEIFRGERNLMRPPVDDIESRWTPMERHRVMEMLGCSIVGSVDTVREGLRALRERTDADEFMVVSDLYDPELRLRSFRLIAEAAGISPASAGGQSAEARAAMSSAEGP